MISFLGVCALLARNAKGGGKKNRTVIERDIKKGYFIFGRIALRVPSPAPPVRRRSRSGENKKRLENVREITREIFLEKIIYFWPAHSCAFHYIRRTSPNRHHQEKVSAKEFFKLEKRSVKVTRGFFFLKKQKLLLEK